MNQITLQVLSLVIRSGVLQKIFNLIVAAYLKDPKHEMDEDRANTIKREMNTAEQLTQVKRGK